ncbi:MAG: SAM-dependent methyltransferase [Crocosphaera sp.]|nr:SAM-dependent methyltransferase [Crocosphaera sp.]
MNQETVIENTLEIQAVPLSESLLWEAQKDYFVKTGIEAWRQNIVPSYVTTNPFIAHTYAELILAYLEDYQVENSEEFDREQPFYILDLGAGSGKFAFHFLRHFLPEYEDRFADRGKFCYVMVDISQANIDFWQSHEQLNSFVEQGVLDFALFDVCNEQSLKLLVSNNIISSQTQNKAIIAIANYLFDSLPHDIFELNKGELSECLVSLHQHGKRVTNEESLRVESIKLNYHNRFCKSEYYEDEKWNNILDFYQSNIKEGVFLLPVGGFHCLQNLSVISNGQFMVLSADKGHHHLESVIRDNKPKLVKHGGCVSFSVNYHALAEYFKQLGGEVLQIPHVHNSINIQAFLLGNESGKFKHTKRVYQQRVREFSPDDFATLKKGFDKNHQELKLEQIIAFLRLSRWDSKVLLGCYKYLLELLPLANSYLKKNLVNGITKIWEQYFHVEEDDDLAFALGSLLAKMRIYQEALPYFHYSTEHYGEHPFVSYNKAICYFYLEEMEEALRETEEVLRLFPDMEEANRLKQDIIKSKNRNNFEVNLDSS